VHEQLSRAAAAAGLDVHQRAVPEHRRPPLAVEQHGAIGGHGEAVEVARRQAALRHAGPGVRQKAVVEQVVQMSGLLLHGDIARAQLGQRPIAAVDGERPVEHACEPPVGEDTMPSASMRRRWNAAPFSAAERGT
jgi:hypothetical protein